VRSILIEMKIEEVKKVKKLLGSEFGLFFDMLNPVIQGLKLDKGAQILDIGTGSGRMAIILALNDYKVLTGEPESDNSEYAKKDWLNDAKKANVDHLITFKAFNAEAMPIDDDIFDAIFILGALHHINDKVSAFNECIRTIKKEGVICIFEPNRRGIKTIRKENPSHPDTVDPRDYADGLPVEIQKGFMFDAYIFNNNIK